jgi:hypothetical protein
MHKQKVFGIGLSRTGTSSLNEALEFLGYRSVHFPIIMQNTSARAKVKYRMNRWIGEIGSKKPLFHDFCIGTENKLVFKVPNPTSFDAMTDMPVARFYKQLDEEFPNSKFILTVRNEDGWLKSCEKFFAEGNNQFFKWIQLHFDMYGANSFNDSLFRNGYRNHIKDVKAYFSARPSDLLIVDIPKGDGWNKLCEFVGLGIPQNPFPNKNASKS